MTLKPASRSIDYASPTIDTPPLPLAAPTSHAFATDELIARRPTPPPASTSSTALATQRRRSYASAARPHDRYGVPPGAQSSSAAAKTVFAFQTKKIIPSDSGPNKKKGIILSALPDTSIHTYVLKLGEKLGGGHNITHATRLAHQRICIYLKTEELVEQFIANYGGLSINNTWVEARRMVTRTEKLTLKKVPPEVSDSDLADILSQAVQVVSPFYSLTLGVKDEGYNHIDSWKRTVYVVRREGIILPDSFLVEIGDTPHRIFIEHNDHRCNTCNKHGHISKDCPNTLFLQAEADANEELDVGERLEIPAPPPPPPEPQSLSFPSIAPRPTENPAPEPLSLNADPCTSKSLPGQVTEKNPSSVTGVSQSPFPDSISDSHERDSDTQSFSSFSLSANAEDLYDDPVVGAASLSERTGKRKTPDDHGSKEEAGGSPLRKKGIKIKNSDLEGLRQIENFYLEYPDFTSIPFPRLEKYLSEVKRMDPRKKAKELLIGEEELLNTLKDIDEAKIVKEQALRHRIHRLVNALSMNRS